MSEQISAQRTAFNQIHRELEEAYHGYALSQGMSVTAFWILYLIWTSERDYTQRELCGELWTSPQTINSALKGLLQQGLVEINLAPGSRKNKHIHLSPDGRELARQTVGPLVQAEHNALARMEEGERALLLTIMRKHISLLKMELVRNQ